MFVYILAYKMKKRKNTPLDFTYVLSLEPRNLLGQKNLKKDNQVTFKKAKNRKRKQTSLRRLVARYSNIHKIENYYISNC